MVLWAANGERCVGWSKRLGTTASNLGVLGMRGRYESSVENLSIGHSTLSSRFTAANHSCA